MLEMKAATAFEGLPKTAVREGSSQCQSEGKSSMQIDRPNMVYRNGLLAEQHRERVNTVPARYKRTWTVRRVAVLDAAQVGLYGQHSVITDDAGNRVIYTCTEDLGAGLTKHQAITLLGQVSV